LVESKPDIHEQLYTLYALCRFTKVKLLMLITFEWTENLGAQSTPILIKATEPLCSALVYIIDFRFTRSETSCKQDRHDHIK